MNTWWYYTYQLFRWTCKQNQLYCASNIVSWIIFDEIDFYMIRPTREHKNDSIKKGEKECSNSRKKFCRKINLQLPSTLYLPTYVICIYITLRYLYVHILVFQKGRECHSRILRGHSKYIYKLQCRDGQVEHSLTSK